MDGMKSGSGVVSREPKRAWKNDDKRIKSEGCQVEKRAGEKAELTCATQSLSSPLLFRAHGLLTISVTVRVRKNSRLRTVRGGLRWRRQKVETRYTRTWPCGESQTQMLTTGMVALTELSI